MMYQKYLHVYKVRNVSANMVLLEEPFRLSNKKANFDLFPNITFTDWMILLVYNKN